MYFSGTGPVPHMHWSRQVPVNDLRKPGTNYKVLRKDNLLKIRRITMMLLFIECILSCKHSTWAFAVLSMSTSCCVNLNVFAISSTPRSQNSVFCFVLFDSASQTYSSALLLSGSWRSSMPSQSKLKWRFCRSWTGGSLFLLISSISFWWSVMQSK